MAFHIEYDPDGRMRPGQPAAAPLFEVILRRSLAAILFLGALIFGSAQAIIIIAALGGHNVGPRPVPWWMVAFIGGIAWVCGWLAILLWTGRSIPTWFIGACLCGPPVGLCVACLVKGELTNAGISLGGFIQAYFVIRQLRSASKKTTIPEL